MSTEIFRETYKASDKNNFIWDEQKVKEFYTYCYNNVFKQPTYPEEMIEKFKASKQQSKDWEIVSMNMAGVIIENKPQINFDALVLKYPNQFIIHSVHRLPDGEIFTVGDKIVVSFCSDSYKNQVIEKFIIADDGHLRCSCAGVSCGIQDISKPKQPLFTTHDNVEIYEGDEYWNVDKENENDKLNWLIWNGIAGSNEFNLPKHNPYKIYFSTESAAKDYVLMNKPIFTLQEIADNYIGEKPFDNYLRFTELAKQKLNQ